MALNSLGVEKRVPPVAPVTLPRFVFTDDIEREAKEAAARVAERKAVRAGRDAWEKIAEVETFPNWLAIGKALLIGRNHAMKATGANAPMGQTYCKAFSEWVKQHGFSRMQKSTRSVAIELAENATAITVWRDSLLEKQRRHLVHPQSVTRRWRAATQHNGKCPQDYKRDAIAAWRKFISCVEALPRSEAAPLWRLAHEQAAARIAV